ncbi:histone-lysine N-methyltransferase, H3 lysine-36 specific-like isoform X3 [Notolabrus celidotus]|nr:histone-lysine N-methyltransferase, H3 lysine-36 specific-like isoform X3 [Notolabrus celidotus]
MMSKRKSRIKPVEDAMSYILSSRDKPWFAERFINNIKGRGVFATEPIEQGSFVLEYSGEFISVEECRSRHYSETQSTFLYEFDWQKRQWCIDASKEDGSLGRLVNDNHTSPNCIMKKVIVNNKPHLCLFAVKNIEIGSELDYNYGDSKWPWRNKVTYKQAPAAEEEEEMAVLPVNLSSRDDDDDDDDDASPKVTYKQAPAAAEEEMAVLPVNLSSHDDDDDASPKVTYKQAPAAAEEEMAVLPVNLSSHDDDDDASPKEFTVGGSSLVDYSDSDESNENCLNDQPLGPHCDEVVPKLRRTKSILMKTVPDFSDDLYDSSDDGTEGPSTQSKSEMASQR